MEETKNNELDALEQEPTDFKEQINTIYNTLPLSVQKQYKKSLTKNAIEDDFETEQSYTILQKLNEKYLQKKERSRISSQLKRDQKRESLQPKKLEEPTIEIEEEPSDMEESIELPEKPDYKPLQRSKKINTHSLNTLFH